MSEKTLPERIVAAGATEDEAAFFMHMIAQSGVKPEAAMLRLIADITDDTRLPTGLPVGLLMKRVRSWQATVRRLAEVFAAPRRGSKV